MTKGRGHYARKPYVQAVLNGMTQVEAAAKFGVSAPLVGRHLKQAGVTGRTQASTPQAAPTPPPQTAQLTDLLVATIKQPHNSSTPLRKSCVTF